MNVLTKKQLDGLRYYSAIAIANVIERRRAMAFLHHPSNATKVDLERLGLIQAVGESSGILFRISDAGRATLAA